MSRFSTGGSLKKFMLLGLLISAPMLKAVNGTFDNLTANGRLRGNAECQMRGTTTIGTSSTPQTLTAWGNATFRGNAIVGTSSDNSNLTVWGETSHFGNNAVAAGLVGNDACKQCVYGVVDFDPQIHQLALQFCDTTTGNHGAIAELTFCSTVTCDAHPYHEVVTIQKFPCTYVNPHDAAECIQSTAVYINESSSGTISANDDDALEENFRLDGLNRMCIGLADDDEATFYQWPSWPATDGLSNQEKAQLKTQPNVGGHTYSWEEGCLFYKVTGCNLLDVTVTATQDVAFDLLEAASEYLANLITENTADEDARDAVAQDIIDLGDDFLDILLDLVDETNNNANPNDAAVIAIIDSIEGMSMSLSLDKIIAALAKAKKDKTIDSLHRMIKKNARK